MKLTWDLEGLFPGGSGSKKLETRLSDLQSDLERVAGVIDLKEAILLLEKVQAGLSETGSFIHCLLAQDTSDRPAKKWLSLLTSLESVFEQRSAEIEQRLLEVEDFDAFLDGELEERAFVLKEMRTLASFRLPPEKERLISELSIDGYHSWSHLYDGSIGRLTFPFRGENLYAGQIENKFSDPDPAVRSEAFSVYTKTFKKNEELFASLLNHLGGFRIKMYEARQWKSIHFEPLFCNRMSEKTLDAMWTAVSSARNVLADYLKRKAKLLGKDKLGWEDLEAPLGAQKADIPYKEGAQFIIDQFQKYSPKMAAFSEKALKEGWVEAEDRPGKRPGGFCTTLSESKQTRIFMTYSGTLTNVTTLAHELGHAFHADCLFPLPVLNQHCRMNLAETASTMAEMIVAEGAYESATDAQEKLALLDEKVARSCAFLMNLHARFLFETRFYERRKKGLLLADELSVLMEEAQKEAYAEALSHYHPLFWASKGHFYITEVPFYNFPYTFGHLFSLGIYQELKKDKASFEKRYIALLEDSGRMMSEDLAQKTPRHRPREEPFLANSCGPLYPRGPRFFKN